VMNAMLASGGYPKPFVRVEDRAVYLAALDRASIDRHGAICRVHRRARQVVSAEVSNRLANVLIKR
jgi:hypothetical protein